MSVSDGQIANAALFNSNFVSKTDAQSVSGGKNFTNYIATTPLNVATTATITALSSANSVVRMTGSTATSIQGITAGVDGQVITIFNASSAAVTLLHQNGSATAINRMVTFTGASIELGVYESVVLRYYASESRWLQETLPLARKFSQTATKTSTYPVAATDETIPVDGTSAFTTTLPTAVGITGKRYKFIRIDQTLANAVTIATTSAQTINGASTFKLMTQYEMVEVESNGANWLITNRFIPMTISAWTPTFVGFGTVSAVDFIWWRSGATLVGRGRVTCGTTTAVVSSFTIPTGLITSSAGATVMAGIYIAQTVGAAGNHGGATLASAGSSTINFGDQRVFGGGTSTTELSAQLGSNMASSGDILAIEINVPIANWEG